MRVWPPLAATLAEAEMTAEDGMTSEEAAMRLDAVLAGNEGPSAAPSDSEQDARSENVAHHDIPLEAQQDMLARWFVDGGYRAMCDFLDKHWFVIAQAMWSRLESGYAEYGSRMYGWDAQTRRRNAIEEVADLGVYLSSGPT